MSSPDRQELLKQLFTDNKLTVKDCTILLRMARKNERSVITVDQFANLSTDITTGLQNKIHTQVYVAVAAAHKKDVEAANTYDDWVDDNSGTPLELDAWTKKVAATNSSKLISALTPSILSNNYALATGIFKEWEHVVNPTTSLVVNDMAMAMQDQVFSSAYKNVIQAIMAKHGRKTDKERRNGKRWYATYKYKERAAVDKHAAKLKREAKLQAAKKVSAHIIIEDVLFFYFTGFLSCIAEKYGIQQNPPRHKKTIWNGITQNTCA